ncbi:MAG: hypothetical protein HOM77_08475, partial [Planctomycetes bacterium]|nr:hypothetical protein [Planctomycetota bacterium]
MAKRPAFLLTLLFCATALTGFAFAANPQQSPLPDLMPEHSSAITQYEMDIVLDP